MPVNFINHLKVVDINHLMVVAQLLGHCRVALAGFAQVSIVSSAAEASAAAPPGGSVSVVVSEGLQLLLPLAGLFDVDKELKRLDKQKQKVRDVGCCRLVGGWIHAQ
jgi:hypothetical protein